jgi:alpha-1,6-mannosyltransferase
VVVAPLTQSRRAMAVIAGFSTWVMVIFSPDGSQGTYSWLHVSLATACGLLAWYVLYRVPDAPTEEPSAETEAQAAA